MMQSTTSVANLTVTDPNLVATPVISPGTGTYSSPQTVSIASATPGATIYYTTTGNVPVVGTGFTRVYTGPFLVSTTTTIRAIAVRSGMTNSNVAAAFLTLNIPGRQSVVKAVPAALEVFPNPVQSRLNVRWNDELEADLKISVFNALGAEVLTYLVGKGQNDYTIDVQSLRSGIYFVKTDQHPNLVRIVKQ
jgi:methionine-rich copper-binding protein CopC